LGSDLWPVVCGTGHRKMPADQFRWMDEQLLRIIEKLQTDHGMEIGVSGMALCFDQRWAELVKFSGSRLHAMLPFSTQADVWPMAAQDHWHEILAVADEVIVVSPDEPTSPRQAAAMLHARNRAMLDVSDIVVACWDPERGKGKKHKGGTHGAVVEACRRKLPIIWLNPDARTVTMPTTAAWTRILVAA